MQIARDDPCVPSSPLANGGGANTDFPKEGGTQEEEYEDDETTRQQTSSSGGEQYRMRLQISARECRDVHESYLHLADSPPIARGWTGSVNLGEVGGQLAAVKLAVWDKGRGEALSAEAQNYLKLQKLWGIYVPRMLSHGTTCDGEVICLATELLRGVELTKERRTPDIGRKAKEALQAVHRAGLLHCDVNLRNFFLVDRGIDSGNSCPAVFVLDFGFSRLIQSKEERIEEMRRLEAIL